MEASSVQIQFLLNPEEQWESVFKIDIELDQSLTKREKSILMNIARSCEVMKMLSGEPDYTFCLKE